MMLTAGFYSKVPFRVVPESSDTKLQIERVADDPAPDKSDLGPPHFILMRQVSGSWGGGFLRYGILWLVKKGKSWGQYDIYNEVERWWYYVCFLPEQLVSTDRQPSLTKP
jgi:hypothetical protein